MKRVLFTLFVLFVLVGCATANLPSNPTQEQIEAAKARDCAAARAAIINVHAQIENLNRVPALQRNQDWQTAYSAELLAESAAQLAIDLNCPPPSTRGK